MNAAFSPVARPFEAMRDNWFQLSKADVQRLLDDGVHEAAYYVENGRSLFVRFQNFQGHWGTPIAVGVPLCKGCEGALDLGICSGCETVHLDAPGCTFIDLKALPNDVWRVSL